MSKLIFSIKFKFKFKVFIVPVGQFLLQPAVTVNTNQHKNTQEEKNNNM